MRPASTRTTLGWESRATLNHQLEPGALRTHAHEIGRARTPARGRRGAERVSGTSASSGCAAGAEVSGALAWAGGDATAIDSIPGTARIDSGPNAWGQRDRCVALSERALDTPVFLVGMPRSGTTILFEVLAAREDLAWFSGHLQRSPSRPALAALSRLADLSPDAPVGEPLGPGAADHRAPAGGPVEAYPLWERCCGERFRYDLLGARATAPERECMRATVDSVLRYHGKPRFAAKITGPARMADLMSIFPDARLSTSSVTGEPSSILMKVGVLATRDRMTTPAWKNGLDRGTDFADWEHHDRAAPALRGAVAARGRSGPGRGLRSRPGALRRGSLRAAFVEDPHAVLDSLATFCDLPPSPRAGRFLDSRFDLRDMNYQWRSSFDVGQIAMLDELIGETLAAYGYAIDHRPLGTKAAPSQPALAERCPRLVATRKHPAGTAGRGCAYSSHSALQPGGQAGSFRSRRRHRPARCGHRVDVICPVPKSTPRG